MVGPFIFFDQAGPAEFELGHHVATKSNFPPSPNDMDFFDVSQAFVDLKADLGDGGRGQLRIGRQHLTLGSSRLVTLGDERVTGPKLSA
ncbi:MAG: alginate export family protein [Chitinophagales bacterium]|nr:alginate export family protein [Hyphomicrobiales bacterium]